MTRPRDTTTDAPIDDRDLYEPAPSAGYRAVYAVLDVDAPDLEVGR